MRSVTERYSERVGCIGAHIAGRRQQAAHHIGDLRLVSGAAADDGLFDGGRCVFSDLDPVPSDRRQRHAPSLAERERSARIRVDERLLDGRFVRAVLGDDCAEALEQIVKTRGQLLRRRRLDHAVRDVSKTGALARHEAPAATIEAWIDAEDENCSHARFQH